MNFSENHFFLSTCSYMRELAKPIFDKLNITRFSFSRSYSDGRLITLTTCPKWLNFVHKEKTFSVVQYYREQLGFERKRIILMDQVDLSPKEIFYLQYNKEELGCDNYITFLENFDNYVDIVHFTTQKTPREPDPSIYLMNIDFIEKFIQYFKNYAMPILIEAEKHVVHIECNNTISNNFNDLYFPKEHYGLNFFKENQCIKLSIQETMCCALILQGMSYRKIANIMNLSTRTIESYLDNVRKKTSCRSKQDLLEALNSYRKFLDIVLIDSQKT